MKKLKSIKSFIILLLALLFAGCTPQAEEIKTLPSGMLEVHFLDVGQADCSLIKLPTGENILVDGGNRDDKDYIEDYLKKQDVKHIDAVIATHPHEDHIGSLKDVLRFVETSTIFLPDAEADTLVYTNLLYAIEEQNVEEIRVTKPMKIEYGEAELDIIAPLKQYNDLNNSSIVFKMTYGETSFLFTGDIEKEAEKDILSSDKYIKSDVLKVAHHGSKTSSTEEFLKKVDPKISVIQVGLNNEYGLPSDSVIKRLMEITSELYRTDENKEIIIYSDGKTLTVETAQGEKAADISQAITYNEDIIGNINSKVYHLSTCKILPAEANRIYFDNRKEAEKEGYKKHKVCVK